MGLDVTGTILTVENAFGFTIPDENAAGLDTVDKLYDYILAHRFRGYQEDCLTGITFYKLRRVMMSILQIPRKEIQGSTKLSEIIPSHRRRTWKALRRETGLRLPQLRRPVWAATIITSIAIGLGIAVPVLLSRGLFNGAILIAPRVTRKCGKRCKWQSPRSWRVVPVNLPRRRIFVGIAMLVDFVIPLLSPPAPGPRRPFFVN